jgi:hypothetical protein
MKIRCAIGVRGGAELVRHIASLAATLGAELLLVHVIDIGPRREPEHLPARSCAGDHIADWSARRRWTPPRPLLASGH